VARAEAEKPDEATPAEVSDYRLDKARLGQGQQQLLPPATATVAAVAQEGGTSNCICPYHTTTVGEGPLFGPSACRCLAKGECPCLHGLLSSFWAQTGVVPARRDPCILAPAVAPKAACASDCTGDGDVICGDANVPRTMRLASGSLHESLTGT